MPNEKVVNACGFVQWQRKFAQSRDEEEERESRLYQQMTSIKLFALAASAVVTKADEETERWRGRSAALGKVGTFYSRKTRANCSIYPAYTTCFFFRFPRNIPPRSEFTDAGSGYSFQSYRLFYRFNNSLHIPAFHELIIAI